jgi:16S rRNA (cytosine967-C5)-methyltransferase
MGEAPADARRIAVETLLRVERDGAWADATLNAALAPTSLDTRDRALATRLVYGTLAWQGLLDWHLIGLSGRSPRSLHDAVRVILRTGLYQILLLERIPPHAAVTTSVDLTKRYVHAAAGMVNAVLRRATRERGTLPLPDPARHPLRHLAVTHSHPEWLVRRWQKCFAPDELRALLTADNHAAPTIIRARPGERDALGIYLQGVGLATTPARFAPDALRVDTIGEGTLADHLGARGAVQSEASQLVALLLAPEPGMRVLDACAAPGGKTTYLADLMEDRGLLVALERHPQRAAMVRRVVRRLGLERVVTVAGDARTADRLLGAARFDRILVDAPCTGLGTLRGHPEVRWTRNADDPARLARLQYAIVEGVLPLLRPGGALVYATCTLTVEENEGVVAAVLAAHPDLARDDAGSVLPATARGLVDATGALRTLPHRDDLDGFYAVRLARRP